MFKVNQKVVCVDGYGGVVKDKIYTVHNYALKDCCKFPLLDIGHRGDSYFDDTPLEIGMPFTCHRCNKVCIKSDNVRWYSASRFRPIITISAEVTASLSKLTTIEKSDVKETEKIES